MSDRWDWEEFAETAFNIILGTVLSLVILSVVGFIIVQAWIFGLGGLVIGFFALVGLALIIAAIVQIRDSRDW